jgi:hypothetical protein
MTRLGSGLLLWLLCCGLATIRAHEPSASADVGDPQLKPLQDLVGQWKGVGQVRRGSTQGAWIEKAEWQWNFADGKSSLAFTAPAGKHLTAGRIVSAKAKTGADAPQSLTLAATLADGSKVDYPGTRAADDTLTFLRDDVPAGAPQRITLRFAAEKQRLVALLERRGDGGSDYLRLAEIGYTREGSDFGKGSTGGNVCIVTGGVGTISVSYLGKQYYVCCTGCKDLFNSDPAKIIAEYQAKLKAKK